MKSLQNSSLAPIYHRYANLEPREQKALLLLSGFFFAIIAWIGIWQPVETSRETNMAAFLEAREDLTWMREHANQIKPHQTGSHSENASLLTIVTDTAQASRIDVAQAEPGSDGSLHLMLAETPFARLLPWLDVLRREHEIRVSQLSIEGQPGKPGYVITSILLRRR